MDISTRGGTYLIPVWIPLVFQEPWKKNLFGACLLAFQCIKFQILMRATLDREVSPVVGWVMISASGSIRIVFNSPRMCTLLRGHLALVVCSFGLEPRHVPLGILVGLKTHKHFSGSIDKNCGYSNK